MADDMQPTPPTPPAVPAPTPAPTPAPAAAPQGDQKDIEDNKVMAAIGYIGILFLVPLLAAKQSKFAQFHAKQGMVLFIADVIVSFIAWIPLIGWALGLAALIVSIYAFLQAFQGKYWELPYLGQYAKKINL